MTQYVYSSGVIPSNLSAALASLPPTIMICILLTCPLEAFVKDIVHRVKKTTECHKATVISK